MAPSTKKTKQAASAAAAPAREEQEQQQVDPLADASLADLEDELTTGPAANWEVAYVFAFLERFTHLVDYDATNPVLPNVMTFEQALIDSSPPASAFAQAAAAAAAATAGASSNPTRTSARLLEETTKQRTVPLTAVAIRNATLSTLNGGNGAAGAEVATSGDKPQQRRSGSPASSLSSLTASESGGDSNAGTTATTTPQDEAAYLAAIQAVETASVPSSLAIDPVPPLLPLEHECPPHSDLLKDIVETFIENLRPIKELSEYHGKKTWFHFLINFVSYRFNADPLYRGGFRWETNLLRTRGLKPGQEKEDKWWKLRWEDKIHLLRQMVDFQLTNAPAVRDLIKEQYDIGHQRNTRRDPSENYLVLPPAGRTSTHVTLFHLDSSPRLYACGNPYKSDSPWIAVSSTLKGYKAFVKTLAEPTSVERVAAGLPTGEAEALLEKEREKQATMMAAKKNKKKAGGLLLAKASGSGKGKGKGTVEVEVGEDRLREERMTRARLEEDLKDMAVYEKHLAALEARRMRASERAARNLSRGFNTPPVATTRSSRLRAREATLRAVNYNENDDGNDDSNINGDNDDADDDDDDDGEGARRKRRRLDDADGNGNGNGNTSSLRSSAAPSVEAEPSTTASTSTTSRRASGGGARQQVPGERRSSRLQQLPAEPSEPDGAELAAPVPDTDAGAGAASVENAPKAEAEAEVAKREEEPAVAKEKEEEEEVKPEPGLTTTTAAPAAAAVISGQDGSTIPATPEEPALAFVAKADGAIPPTSSSLPAEAPVEGGGGVAATKEHGAEQQQQQLMEDVQPAPTAEAA